MNNKILSLEMEIVNVLKTIFDPEIPVNIYELGLIYEIRVKDDFSADIIMTMTSPNCPMADELLAEVYEKISLVEGIVKVNVKLTFDPPWTNDRMSDEAKLDLGFL